MTIDYTHANAEYFPPDYPCAHLYRRVYLGGYYPRFREKSLRVRAACFARKAQYVSEYGYRSMSIQRQLRNNYQLKLANALTPAQLKQGLGGRAAPPGLSGHQYGLAEDVTADSNVTLAGLQPSWDPAAYVVYGEECEREGLVWGQSFGDMPHSNLSHFTSGSELAVLLKIWEACPYGTTDDARLVAVWNYLDALA